MSHSQMYTLSGEFEDLDGEYINSMPFFRKISRNKTELKIAKMIMDNPHPNIVTIYHIGPEYIDMELLEPCYDYDRDRLELDDSMNKAKSHLQSLGIMYIDWKPDNTGISRDEYKIRKLFDFDVSGVIDITTKKWIDEPEAYVSYLNSIKKGLTDPYDIDNYSFKKGIIDYIL